jgi:hypothetical protein
MHEGIQEIQEIRSFFVDLLDNYQSDIAMGNSGRYNSTINSQAGLDGLNAIQPFISSHDRCFVPQPAPHRTSYGVMGSLSQGTSLPQGKFTIYAAFPLNTYLYKQADCFAAVLPTICPLLNLP